MNPLRPIVRQFTEEVIQDEHRSSLQYAQLRRGEVVSTTAGDVTVYLSGDESKAVPVKVMGGSPVKIGDQVWIMKNVTDTVIVGHWVASNLDADTGEVALSTMGNWSLTDGYATVRRIGRTVTARWDLLRHTTTLAVNVDTNLFQVDVDYRPAVETTYAVNGNKSTGTYGLARIGSDGILVLDTHTEVADGQRTCGSAVWLIP